jgi:hypothetical protein
MVAAHPHRRLLPHTLDRLTIMESVYLRTPSELAQAPRPRMWPVDHELRDRLTAYVTHHEIIIQPEANQFALTETEARALASWLHVAAGYVEGNQP